MINQDECLIYAGYIDNRGYGRIYVKGLGKRQVVHRALYEAVNGDVPEGLVLDHLCKNKACINLEHLEVVTHRENTLRADSRAGINARRTHCKNGHKFTPENTKTVISASGYQCRACWKCIRNFEANRYKKL